MKRIIILSTLALMAIVGIRFGFQEPPKVNKNPLAKSGGIYFTIDVRGFLFYSDNV